jgi:hypothetical protein
MINRFSATHWVVTVMALAGVMLPSAQAKQFNMESMPVSSEIRTSPLLLACGGGGSGSYRKPARPGHHHEETPTPANTKPAPTALPPDS